MLPPATAIQHTIKINWRNFRQTSWDEEIIVFMPYYDPEEAMQPYIAWDMMEEAAEDYDFFLERREELV